MIHSANHIPELTSQDILNQRGPIFHEGDWLELTPLQVHQNVVPTHIAMKYMSLRDKRTMNCSDGQYCVA